MKLFLCCVLSLFTALLYAQEEKVLSPSNDAVKWYHEAQIKVNSQNFDAASGLLQKAIAADNHFAEAFEVLGDILRKQKKYEEAAKNYERVVQLRPRFIYQAYLALGISQFNQMKYAEARQNFKNYLSSGQGVEESIRKANEYVENCSFGIAAMASPKPFTPINLGPQVNTTADEYLPSITVDDSTLIYTRRENNNEDFYISSKGDGGWRKSRPLDENINTAEYNEGAGSISADGKDLYYTICGRPGVIGRCDIYVSHRQGYRWSLPKNLGPEVNTESWESQPSISADGRTLYFTSSRPGGYGGFDIWETEKIGKDHWRKPVNLGPQINTRGNEISPFIHPDDQTLYFSSDGLPGLGGKDLYFSRKTGNGEWSKPVNLGYPINTVDDESTLVITADGKKAYFASDKLNGFGGFDLYSFDLYESARPENVNFIKGNISDEESKEKIDAKVEVIRLKDGKVIYSALSDKVSGDFLAGLPSGFDYAFHVSRRGYLFYSENLSLKDDPGRLTHSLEIFLRRIAAGKKDILRNVFFDTDSYMLKPESKSELDRLVIFMKMNPGIKIEVSGHTDDHGAKQHNLALSENRAKAVTIYLVSTGKIAISRLTYRGYGETQPLAPNLNEKGRALNRRTEFMITAIEK